eukprot:929066-Prymnesium_polylepis.1
MVARRGSCMRAVACVCRMWYVLSTSMRHAHRATGGRVDAGCSTARLPMQPRQPYVNTAGIQARLPIPKMR